MMIEEYLKKLNHLRAAEMRMHAVYRIAAQGITGPWRDALAEQFKDHAKDEDRHADIVMRRIVALGGEIETEILPIPKWKTLDETLVGIKELEAAGVKAWQELHNSLDYDDGFRGLVSEILTQEQHHCDEAYRWAGRKKEELTSSDDAKADKTDVTEVIALAEDLPSDLVVGDKRSFKAYKLSSNYTLDDEYVVGEAWQDEDGKLHGTGLCAMMLFEPLDAAMYHDSSMGIDESPLVILATRLAMSSFVRIEWDVEL